jgi:predicted AlkP superfamily pyrophosphatase or phosphodiesterase
MGMKRTIFFLPALLFVLSGSAQSVPSRRVTHVILISVDGLRPDMYLDSPNNPKGGNNSNGGWPTPNLRWLMKQGTYARHMRSVFPAYTYPSHTAMVTGALPARSGIYYNQPKTANGQWDWYSTSIRVPTIWKVLKANGLTTAAVQWPLSAMDAITYSVPEIFDIHHPDDRITLTRNYATGGLIDEIERNATGVLDSATMSEDYFSMDDNSARMAGYIFRTKRPAFLAMHLASVDGMEHEQGREGDSVRLAMASNDHDIGLMLEAIKRSGAGDSTVIIIVGDHGFSDFHEVFRPNMLIQGIGAKFITAGGSAFLYPTPIADGWPPCDSNRLDKGRQKRLQQLADVVTAALNKLPEDKRKLFRIVDRAELDKMGADSAAILALAAVPGLVFSGAVKPAGAVNNGPGTQIQQNPLDGVFIAAYGGHHGYDPNLPEMYTGFIATGPGIKKGGTVADLCETDISPLVYALLGIDFKTPDGKLIPGILVNP